MMPLLVQNFEHDLSNRVSRLTSDLSDNGRRPVSGDVFRYRVNRTPTKEAGNKAARKSRRKELAHKITQHDRPQSNEQPLWMHALREESVAITQHQRVI